MDIVKTVGIELKRLRLANDLTQADLAARLQATGMEAGSSSKTVSAWERGETPLPLPALWPLSVAFRLEPGALARRLGICGPIEPREVHIAEGADILAALNREPPEVAATLVAAFRQTMDIVRATRLALEN